ncbi:MAG: Fic family protein [Desulfuromonadales bacterium]|nr:Fic family protein [Desulfuromonadales bacterium]
MPSDGKLAEKVTFFRGERAPERGTLAGYSALINAYALPTPPPRQITLISEKNRDYDKGDWNVLPVKRMPAATLPGHLTFALKNEGVHLLVLKALFNIIEKTELEQFVHENPVGIYARKVWFLYEWLTDEVLNIADAVKGNYADLLDEKLQYTCPKKPSKRHRINNNLPGTKDFCPLIWKTSKLEEYLEEDLSRKAHNVAGKVHPALLARAASFLLLKDSKASFDIEGEKTSAGRIAGWGKIIGQAGMNEMTEDELLRLQSIVIGDARFTNLGWRKEGGFIGEHDRRTHEPIPDHISARWQDLGSLVKGLLETEKLQKECSFDPLLAATTIAFGFVFIHPFEDGNGRIHRYLIHHILTSHQFAPAGLVFPVSAVILNRIVEYRKVLEKYSRPLLDFIEWRPTEGRNVEVLNETIDYYRFFDATDQAEFLCDCVKETIEKILPDEISYLENYDEMKSFIDNYLTMPDNKVDLLIRFLEKGNGSLSERALSKEFAALTDDERVTIENKFKEVFLED